MNKLKDLGTYYGEWRANRHLTQDLVWFKKHRGIKWCKGQNFGDYLSCIIVAEAARKLGLTTSKSAGSAKLLAIGSILHFAKEGDVVWGSGVNGKIPIDRHSFSHVDIRMVRGPKTANFLKARGIHAGDVYGDPALLLPTLFPSLSKCTKPGKILILPNLNELNLLKQKGVPNGMRLIAPLGHWRSVLAEILSSELVITSSLHGLILAEAFGVAVRFVAPCGGETLFKYEDYLEGTGRRLEFHPQSFNDEITIHSGCTFPKPVFDSVAMLRAFPVDRFISKDVQ